MFRRVKLDYNFIFGSMTNGMKSRAMGGKDSNEFRITNKKTVSETCIRMMQTHSKRSNQITTYTIMIHETVETLHFTIYSPRWACP